MPKLSRYAVLAALLALWPLPALSQGTARSLDIDTSIRAAGMGGANAAVTWGDPNVWGNVATLGWLSGARWEHGRTQLVPGLATDVVFASERLLVGGGGIGVCFTGRPPEYGHQRLDYGLSTQTDAGGNVIGTFSSYEETRARGIAFSLPRILDDVLALTGRPERLSPAFELSYGVYEKHTRVQLAPGAYGGAAESDTRDWGLQARVSPLELLPRAAGTGFDPRERFLLDFGYGRSVLNAGDDVFVFPGYPGYPPTRNKRSGFAVRAGVKLPPVPGGAWNQRLLAGLSPLLAVGYAKDRDENDAGGTGAYAYDVDKSGFEISLANVFTLRRGHVTDRVGSIDGATTGWGLGVPLGGWAGFRYDEATTPQATDSGLPDVKRKGWTAWVDPVRLWADLNGRQRAAGRAQ
jgi:hypothetical protein